MDERREKLRRRLHEFAQRAAGPGADPGAGRGCSPHRQPWLGRARRAGPPGRRGAGPPAGHPRPAGRPASRRRRLRPGRVQRGRRGRAARRQPGRVCWPSWPATGQRRWPCWTSSDLTTGSAPAIILAASTPPSRAPSASSPSTRSATSRRCVPLSLRARGSHDMVGPGGARNGRIFKALGAINTAVST